MADDVWGWCDKAGSFGRTVTVKIKYADFRLITRSRSAPLPVPDHDQLRRTSLDLIRLVLPTEQPIRLVGVTVSNFEPAGGNAQALPLFADSDKEV